MEYCRPEENTSYARILSLLISDLYSGKGLQAIADRGAELLDNPIIILDTSFKVLAVTSSFVADDVTMQQNQKLGYLSEHTVKALKASRYLHKLGASRQPIKNDPSANAIHNVSIGHGWIDGAIRLQGIVIGYICVYGAERPFEEEDVYLTEKLAELASMEFQKDPVFLQNHGVQFEALLIDCLNGKISDPLTLISRMQNLNRDIEPPLYILAACHCDPSAAESRFIPGFQSMFRRFFPQSISAVYENHIVLLTSECCRSIHSFSEDEDLLLFLTQNNLCLGISAPYMLPGETESAYRQALYCAQAESESPVRCFSNYTVDYAVSELKENLPIHNLCNPVLLKMAQSGKEFDLELLKTLYYYIHYMKNSEKAIEKLHIHKNTFFYRVNKIKDLLDLDLNNGREVLSIFFSYKILEQISLIRFDS